YYVVDRHEMIIISTDPIAKPANLTLWTALRQGQTFGGWNLASLSGAKVAELNAIDPNAGTPLADVTAGLMTFDGAGNVTFNYDENDGGTMNLAQTSSGTYAIDATGAKTGRVTLSGLAQFGGTQPILYLVSSDSVLFIGTDPKATSGLVETQSAGQ